MKRRASILESIFAAIVALIGLVVTVGALSALRSFEELRRLLTYDYTGFVDGEVVGGMVTDFFIGVAVLLVGSALFMKMNGVRRLSKVIAGALLLFISVTLVYACLNPRIGVRP